MSKKNGDIAVIGMAGKFPGANSVAQFWQNLCEGRESIYHFSDTELRNAGVSESDIQNNDYVKASPVLDSIDKFDPGFFKISPVEAQMLDPQIRLLLQTAWETLEDAGLSTRTSRNIGVFAGSGGITTSYYSHFINKNSHFEKVTAGQTHLGNDKDFLATYISYKLNLTGPSITIQTACSTSLVALHQACSSLRNEECDMALAGGVTIRVPHVQGYLHKDGHIVSKTGHVRTFDETADGVVFGSGMGLVLLRPLDMAIEKRNHIYAVIKGSAINNDGKGKMSYAASSARGQINCITQALKNADVTADTIGYVEAHGTGTYMGDPEEVKALSNAFKKQTEQKGYCVLGAVKTNVGHLEAAAGITGLIKAALTLHHGYIPPTLHFTSANPRIKFERTPFYVNNTLQRFEEPEGLPRRAAVNSLGVGGTNAFVILEAFDDNRERFEWPENQAVAVPLSAKNESALYRYIEKLENFLSHNTAAHELHPDAEIGDEAWAMFNIDIADLAFTLQVGREHMEHRVAFVVRSTAELRLVLAAYLRGDIHQPQVLDPMPVVEGESYSVFSEEEDGQEVIQGWIRDNRWRHLAKAWVNGEDIPWLDLYVEGRPRKLSLPTYPFAKESHWMDSSHTIDNVKTLHPLLHSNTSDLSHQAFTSRFSGEEFFLRDHLVKTDGQQARAVLPGVAYLEMARIAANRASNNDENNVLVLHDIVWLQPIVVTEPVSVSIALYGHETGGEIEQIEYEIYSLHEDDEQIVDIVHCQGMASFDVAEPPSAVDLPQLKTQMQRSHFSAEVIYPALKETGLDYGPAHQAIAGLWLGENEVLAQLELPAAVLTSVDDFVLHPSMLDGALQATNALVVDLENPPKNPLVPFAMGRVEIYGSCEREMYVHVRYAEGADSSDKLIKLDLDMFDDKGELKVRMLGFTARVIGKEADALSTQQDSSEVLMAEPYWQDVVLPKEQLASELTRHVLLVDLPHIDAKALQLQMQSGIVVTNELTCDERPFVECVVEGYREMALTCFGLAKRLLESKPKGKVLCQVMVNRERKLLQGLSGLLKTVTWENPNIETQLLLVDKDIEQQHAATLLDNNAAAVDAHTIRYLNGIRQVQQWRYIETDLKAPMAFKEQGVYLITGGLGGLGVLFARHILEQTSNAKVVLSGRAEFAAIKNAPEKIERFESLQSKGRLSYVQMDLESGESVKGVIDAIVNEHGSLSGILHSAGMIVDNFIIHKSSDDFARVLAPKVSGTLHLDEASKQLELDFMVLFSSVTSAIGNIGQADYAAANGFMDQFAAYRNEKVKKGERQGFTLAINWPLWAEGGMGLDKGAIDGLRQSTGIYPMRTQTGLAALDRALWLQSDLMLVMEGDLPQLKRTLQSAEQDPGAALEVNVVEQTFIEGLVDKTEQLLCRELAGLLKMSPSKIDPEAPMEKYGIDSILAIDLTNTLEKSFGPLSKTLFFEYQTIRELTDYFINNHGARLSALLSSGNDSQSQSEKSKPAQSDSDKTVVTARQRFARARKASTSRGKVQTQVAAVARTADCPIAIVGLGGRYPGATNTIGFWENLRDGKDCVVEVPKSRWDWQQYYSEDRKQSGFHFSKWGGFIEGVDEFDPRFFNISPREAQTMDPQERLFLQTAWVAIEDAGYTRASLQIANDKGLPGQVGVYAGVMYNEYQLLGAEASLQGQRMGFASNPASIANRVSYVLNLHGPSMTIDTMCSSSLTTVHLACQDLKLGITDLAIAGGVNVTIHPNKYLMLSSGQFISSDGHCQSFGEGGDGYIPAEGVGVVVLKRFEQARVDGNHIYGIIRGSALSHGGKTNGYTVPNPQAQADAVTRALHDGAIDPRQISYIEAHGTGTKLGDPIEIAALTKAFYGNGKALEGRKDRGFCDIGSAKSNIGHAESAAGIAGLTKILLQMHYRQIVPSLHSSKLNPHIDFDNTPFVVNQTLKPWLQPQSDGRPIPRIAGVSSFGAGGANAHVIIEEYSLPESERNVPLQYGSLIVPLSARTAEQLQQKVGDLLDYIDNNTNAPHIADRPWLFTLDRIAYTLQVGREAMGERLAIVVKSLDELTDKLRAIASGESYVEDVYRGEVKENQDTLSLLGGDSDFLEAVNKWISSAKLAKLAELWVKGFELDWSAMYRDHKPRLLSLPGYPFAKDRFWVDLEINRAAQALPAQSLSNVAALHPLLHENTSTLHEQRFSSSYNSQNAGLYTRFIHGRAIAAGSVYLDLLQSAFDKLVSLESGNSLRVEQLSCATPLALDGSFERSHISLYPASEKSVEFDIYSDAQGAEILHSQGMAKQVKPSQGTINIEGFKDSVDAQIDGGYLQTRFAEHGVRFVQSSLKQVWLKDNIAFALLQNTQSSLAAVVDGALQACLAFEPDNSQYALSLAMPFDVARLTVLPALSDTMYALISKEPSGLHLTLCDEQGNVCAELEGIVLGDAPSVVEDDAPRKQTILTTQWQAAAADTSKTFKPVVLFDSSNQALAEQIQGTLLDINSTSVDELLTAAKQTDGLIDLSGDAAMELWLPLIQALVEQQRKDGYSMVFAQTDGLKGADKVGLYHMLSAEYPAIKACHVLSTDAGELLEALSNASQSVAVKYQDGKRLTAQLVETQLNQAKALSADSVVLITGGTRGIGMTCAEHLVSKHGVKKLILTGREVLPPTSQWQDLAGFSESTKAKITAIKGLMAKGAEVLTLSFPLDDAEELKQQYQQIQAQFGEVTCVLHAAGLTDGENPAFIRKTVEGIKRVQSPKVAGLNNLIAVLNRQALEQVVLFSSVSAMLPTLGAGQSDYVMANHYMDCFAQAHQGQLSVVSVQWPSWKESGMGEVTNQAYRNTGLLSMTNAEGLAMLDSILSSDFTQAVVMPLVVNADSFDAGVLLNTTIANKPVVKAKAAPSKAVKAVAVQGDDNIVAVQQWLADIVEQELKMDSGELDINVDLADYGIDSILMVQVLRSINQVVGEEVDPSVVLEYPTVVELAGYLQSEYANALAAKFGGESAAVETIEAPAVEPETQANIGNWVSEQVKLKRKDRSIAHKVQNSVTIAVVGMSCRFAGANNLEEYWQLLRDGHSAIKPVPFETWGKQTDYYGALLDEIYGFDPDFFLVSPDDAKVMDPQALMLLEESLKTFYHAGYEHKALAGKNIGVYVGARSQSRAGLAQLEAARNPILAVGQNYLAANLSQFFNFAGASMVVDTACSSAMVGMRMAVDAMRSGIIEGALVGGVSLQTSSLAHDVFASRDLHTKNGEFHILDQRAGGVVIGEGCGMVYLKPMSHALRDGDTIYAEISALEINNDGRTAGPATPNMDAQRAVMQTALSNSGIAANQVGYLEVNGSGSEITDLLEVKAINKAYSDKGGNTCYLGSMKPNIGHPLCAEGIASFIKVALMLHHQQLVPFLSGQQPLQHFSLEKAGYQLPRKADKLALEYAAMNCFADGGTNAHVILKHGSEQHRAPLPQPQLNRIDVRSGEPLAANISQYRFNQDGPWSNVLTIDHPVLANHKVYDKSLLPGLAWIDLLYSCFAQNGLAIDQLRLRNLSIYRPLIVTEQATVELQIHVDSDYQVSVLDTSGERYISCEISQGDKADYQERVDVEAIAQAAKTTIDIADIYKRYRDSHNLHHSEVMLAQGKVYTTDDATWVHIQVPGNDAGDHLFHPTLIDGSAIGTADLFEIGLLGDDEPLFLPMFYEQFSAANAFGSEVFTRIKHDSVVKTEQLQGFTLEFFSTEGEKLGELSNHKNKQVRDTGLFDAKPAVTTVEPALIESQIDSQFDSFEALLQSVVAAQLQIEPSQVTVDSGYYEMGLLSVGLLAVVKTVAKMIGEELSPLLMFEHTNIASMAKYLRSHYRLPNAQDVQQSVQATKPKAKRAKILQGLTTHAPLGFEHSGQNNGTTRQDQDIAIIGMAGRYPQAPDLDTFWQNLKDGIDSIETVPESRWSQHHFSGMTSPSGKPMSKWGGFLSDVDCFDPLFFNVSPKEAGVLDPQERLFLQTCWQAMEDAGYTPQNIVETDQHGRRAVGVFVGVMHKDYTLLQAEAARQGQQISMSLNYAGIANRVSYFSDFHGPSMAIDTVCSSSLTAVHLALESLYKGESKVAFAGGVNLSLHPNKYQSYGLMDFHSSDGRCTTFGADGDGYVSSEGVGAVVLKPLAKAIADGDHIEAVIKGSAINHVGRVSGITVPSPVAQGAMIADCLRQTGVNPESISYIEAHGTGTSLGDPIEIEGLNKAFGEFTEARNFCALGSVKSNIGHCEAAAGISGLCKTVLQLKNQTLVKSLHSETINPYLDLHESPFFVQRETAAWPAINNQPRRAGISSFGATGSNAHVIVEEFAQAVEIETQAPQGVLLLLSAKNAERLAAYAERLSSHLQQHPQTDIYSLSFTLQTGRVELEERLALVVNSIEQAVTKLDLWLEGQGKVTKTWQGNVKSAAELSELFDSDDDMQEVVEKLLNKRKLDKLGQFWVKGLSLNWLQLYAQGTPMRISLPSYPFAKQRFWVDVAVGSTQQVPALHPLLQQNVSDLAQQRYRTTFSGDEFYLSDHLIGEDKVLPGVAYLEMAQIAARQAMPGDTDNLAVALNNITWVKPVIAKGKAVDVEVALTSQADGSIGFEVLSEGQVHCQGKAQFTAQASADELNFDIEQLKTLGSAAQSDSLYSAFRYMDIHHGPMMQGVQTLYLGNGQLLAQLSIPEQVKASADSYMLHPSIMDSAFQATLGLNLNRGKLPQQPLLPFALDSLKVIKPCQPNMFAYVRHAQGHSNAHHEVARFDIDLLDEHGQVCVQMHGLSSRRAAASASDARLHSYLPVWDAVSFEVCNKENIDKDSKVYLVGDKAGLNWLSQDFANAEFIEYDQLAAIDNVEQLIWLAPQSAQANDLLEVFNLVKAQLNRAKINWTFITRNNFKVFDDETLNSDFAGVHGLVGTLAKEYPHWSLRLLDIDSLENVTAKSCLSLRFDKHCNGLVHRRGEWFAQNLVQCDRLPQAKSLYRDGGVYVLIGGAGGLGEVYSRYLAEHFNAQTVWIGRKALSADIQVKIDNIGQVGPAPLYLAADATDADAMMQVRQTLEQRFGGIHGVIHSAIVLNDQSLAKMDEQGFSKALSAKVDVSKAMDQVFGELPLDFMLFFSSVNSYIRGAGQANYAAGCTFKDSFAATLAAKRSYPVKVVNWGFWGSVGSVAEPQYIKRLAQMGLASIEIDEGIAALNQLMQSQVEQISVLKTFAGKEVFQLKLLDAIEGYEAAEAVLPWVKQQLPRQLGRNLLSKKQLSALEVELPVEAQLQLADELMLSSLLAAGLIKDGKRQVAEKVASFYQRWLEQTIDYLQTRGWLNSDLSVTREVGELETLWSQWQAQKPSWQVNAHLESQTRLVEACLRALPEIIQGNVPATDVMFPNSSMELVEGIYKNNDLSDFYNEILGQTMVQYIRKQLKNNPDTRIRLLEIGAGTGGTTARLLPMLQEFAQNIDEYCYTDLSKAFLMHAQKHYLPQFPQLTTAIFDATKALEGQGIEAGQFDIVIATNVLHATPNIRQTVRNAKAVLKHEGIILLNEISTWKLFNHLTFGLLEGWWLYQDEALRLPGNPGLEPAKWKQVLEQEGYQNVYFAAQKAHHLGQQVVAAASNGLARQPLAQVVAAAPVAQVVAKPTVQAPIVQAPVAQPSVAMPTANTAEQVFDVLKGCIADAVQMNPADIESDRSFSEYGVDSIIAVQLINQINDKLKLVLQTTVLFDYGNLEQLSVYISEEYSPVQIVQTSVPVQVSTTPMAQDALKETLRECVAAAIEMSPLDIEGDREFSEYGVDSIIAVQLINQINEKLKLVLQTTVLFDYGTLDKLAAHIAEEYADKLSTQVTTSVSAPVATAATTSQIIAAPSRLPAAPVATQVAPTVQVAGQGMAYHRLLLNGPGDIGNIQISQDTLGAPAEGEVCVALKAFSLNFGDLLCVRGLYPTMPPYPFTPGYDGSGVVIAVGRGVSKVKVGDEVIVEADVALGAHATAMIAKEHNVTKKPKAMPFEDACALPVVTITMLDAFNKAKMQPGESILIQTAAGGTGLIAVQLAKHAGATIYATAGSAHKLQYLKDLGVDHVINYQETDFEAEIARLTGGRGVDVVINTLSGDAIQKGMNCLATGGRYIEIAMTALKSAKAIDLSILSNNQSFHSVDMRRFALESPQMTEGYRQQMLSLYNQGVLRPTICETFEFDQLQAAYQALSDRSNIGKVVVTVPQQWQVDSAALAAHASQRDDIAIVGMSGRFAESENLNEFWQHLAQGDDLVREVTRWAPADSTPTPDKPYCAKGSFIETMDLFDPLFFKLSHLEALHMDPQQRVFLEESYKALEDAGYAGADLSQSDCGVYVGCIDGLYDTNFTDEPPGQAFWGNACSVIAARIAYYLDLHGPAIAVDTACSSSLVAIHMACQGLWAKETDMALAGGVFIQSSPKFYQHCNRAGMLSPNGKCHTFDARADGFVPGEGAGVVMLKRLSDALSANDNIHGVIIGSGINQDGATNGITAPSSLSQTRLERSVYERFDIDPASLQMIEAHGTGTKLGDPIEFAALSKAFGDVPAGNTAVGSVKTNIGHAVTAAGVASVLKLLMAMKHEQMPPSIHFDNANPVIDFDNSPFYVPTELTPWQTLSDSPRRGAVSSFGFSGTNAHIVLQQGPAKVSQDKVAPAYLIVLSALSDAQRNQQVDNLMGYLEQNQNVSLNNMSFTLFVGRQHLSHRLCVVARNQDELLARLQQYRQSGKAAEVTTGELNDKAAREQASIKDYGNQCIAKCQTQGEPRTYIENLNVIADLYTQGYKLNYRDLFGSDCGRLSLPTYPFARERFWAGDKPRSPAKAMAKRGGGQLHPLLHRNTSDLTAQRFSSELDASAFYLADHQVEIQGKRAKVLPAVAYLEMAHAAITRAIPNPQGVVVLSNTVWAQPIVVDDSQAVDIVLIAENGPSGQIDFEICTENTGHSQINLHCQGAIELVDIEQPAALDINRLQTGLTEHWQSAELYNAFSQMGLHYGPAQQGLTKLYLGQDEVLAKLQLPAQLQGDAAEFVLHPSVMDSALQATIALIEDLNQPPSQPALPFALDELQVFAPCAEQMWAYVTVVERNADSIKLDIQLCDEHGHQCVLIQGFSTRAQGGKDPGSEGRFDDAFYQDVLDRLLDNQLSIDAALDLE